MKVTTPVGKMRLAVAFLLLALGTVCAGKKHVVYSAESLVDGDDSYVDSIDQADGNSPAKNVGYCKDWQPEET